MVWAQSLPKDLFKVQPQQLANKRHQQKSAITLHNSQEQQTQNDNHKHRTTPCYKGIKSAWRNSIKYYKVLFYTTNVLQPYCSVQQSATTVQHNKTTVTATRMKRHLQWAEQPWDGQTQQDYGDQVWQQNVWNVLGSETPLQKLVGYLPHDCANMAKTVRNSCRCFLVENLYLCVGKTHFAQIQQKAVSLQRVKNLW